MDADGKMLTLCRNLTIYLGRRCLLSKVSLRVERGRVTVLMGPSGVGKSILADVLFGLQPTRYDSQLHVSGCLGSALDEGALVFQSGGGLPHLKVSDNLHLVRPNKGAIAQLLKDFHLDPEQLAPTLSGGQSRQLATARALLAERSLLWLDEPAAGLDVTKVDELCRQLQVHASHHNIAVVVTTHRAEFAVAVADQLLFLGFGGKLVEIVSPTLKKGLAAHRVGWEVGQADVLEARLRTLITSPTQPQTPTQSHRRHPLDLWGWIERILTGLYRILVLFGWREREARRTFVHVFRLTAIESGFLAPFIGFIFGAIFRLIFELYFAFISTGRILVEFGPTIVLRLSPGFAAILVAASSGSTLSSWIGQMTANRQLDALSVLGVRVHTRIVGPAWVGMALSGVLGTFAFALALTSVFAAYLWFSGEGNVMALLPRFTFQDTGAALAKTTLFGMLIASVIVTCAVEPKRDASEVASAVTRGTIRASIAVMLLELVILSVQFFTQ
jgi:ABC-type multidrug transport system ATPase subunit/ABC-type transporter Mla maintaining outer membrane lipid asymmetry permease subunit MlaE